MNSRILALVAISLTTNAALAQINPAVGTPFGSGDDSIFTVTTSFPIALPDGTTTTDLAVDSNGRVTSDLTQTSDFSESVAEFLGEPPVFAAYWDDLDPTGGGATGDVFFNDLGTSVLFTWQDVVVFGGAAGEEFTFQCEIFPDGTVVHAYDARLPLFSNDGLIGLTDGNGAADPGETDLSMDFSSAGVATVYEDFVADADIAGGTLTFTPDGSGGYDLTSDIAVASATAGGPACTPALMPIDLTFTPDGAGGYNSSLAGSMDAGFAGGTDLALGDDAVGNIALPFSFTLPSGTAVTDLDVDSNGRLTRTGVEPSDFSESLAEFFGDATAIIAPYWDDFDPSSGGVIWFNVVGGGSAVSVTWDAVPEFGATTLNTFQVQLFPSGAISFHYQSMASTDGLVGVSSGNGVADPGAVDLSAGPAMSGAVGVLYEQFTGGNDLGAPQVLPSLENGTRPIIGMNFDLAINNAPASIGDFYLLGNPSTFPLGALGIPCSLETDGILATINTAPGAGFSLTIPNLPGLVGQSLNTQGAVLDLAAGNPFFVLFTNSIDFTFGSL
ncbi:MAG: hypothetical protein AAF196_09360 [Planctomycetota bacterium]